MRRLALSMIAAAAALLSAGSVMAEPPRVVVSIPPLHSIVASVAGDLAAPVLLIDGAASPHAYALRPSDARALREAELIVWVGPRLEGVLAKPIATLGGRARVLTAAEAEGVALLPVRTGGLWGAGHDHDGEAEEGAHDGHGDTHAAQAARADAGEHYDPHLWLDPRNAAAIARAAAGALAAIDPANAARYRANADAFAARIDARTAEWSATLAPVAGRPFLVFHDAYAYLEHRFGLTAVGAVTLGPERPAGAAHLAALRRAMDERGVGCVFAEPQFRPDLADALVEDTRARVAVLDPVGADLPPGPALYERLIDGLVGNAAECLAR